MRARIVVSLLQLPLLFSTGCSFLFVQAPPAGHAELSQFDCTSSMAAPVLDTVAAGFQVVRTGIALAADEADYADFPLSRGADIALGLGFTALFTAAFVHGFSTTADCEDAKSALAQRSDQANKLQSPHSAPGGAPVVCSYDAQCKGERICEAGICVAPQAPVPPAAPPPDSTPEAAPPPASTHESPPPGLRAI